MPIPLIPLAVMGGISALGSIYSAYQSQRMYQSNMYTLENNRKLWKRELDAYNNLYGGYASYLKQHGRTINPNRAWTSYYGTIEKLRNNIANSYNSADYYAAQRDLNVGRDLTNAARQGVMIGGLYGGRSRTSRRL